MFQETIILSLLQATKDLTNRNHHQFFHLTELFVSLYCLHVQVHLRGLIDGTFFTVFLRSPTLVLLAISLHPSIKVTLTLEVTNRLANSSMARIYRLHLLLLMFSERTAAFSNRLLPLPRSVLANDRNRILRLLSNNCSLRAKVPSESDPANPSSTNAIRTIEINRHQPPLMNLYTISKEDLQQLVASWGYPRYRADQVYHWIREKGVLDVNEMKNIPKKLRQDIARFSSSTPLGTTDAEPSLEEVRPAGSGGALEIVREQVSPKDGTLKRLYRLRDGLLIESVLMPYDDGRWTTCISSQVRRTFS